MARKKSTETIDAEIARVIADMSKLQDRYDKLAEKPKDLGADYYNQFNKERKINAYLKKVKSTWLVRSCSCCISLRVGS